MLEALLAFAQPRALQNVMDIPALFNIDLETAPDKCEGVVDVAYLGCLCITDELRIPLAISDLLNRLDVQTVIER